MARKSLSVTANSMLGVKVYMGVTRRSNAVTAIQTWATRISVGEWTTIDGQVVDGRLYPQTLKVSVVCSPGALVDSPRVEHPWESPVVASNRWVAGRGYDGAVWSPVDYSLPGNYMELLAGGYDQAEGAKVGTSPTLIPAGEYVIYDAWSKQWIAADVIRFSGPDMMTTRSGTWVTNEGMAALGVFIIDEMDPAVLSWVLGFTTPDPTEKFGLGVAVRAGSVASLVMTDNSGDHILVERDIRSDMLSPVMLGMQYSSKDKTATLYVRGQHIRESPQARLETVNGRDAGEALAALDFGVMYSLGETSACVLDVAMWVGPPGPGDIDAAINTYTRLYGTGVSSPGNGGFYG